ncbi:MAG: GAF domain-containing protein [Chitinophagales bacterium]
MKGASRFTSYSHLAFQVGCFMYFFFLSPLVSNGQPQSEKGLPFITNYAAKTFNALPQTWSVQQDENGIMYFGVQNYILEYDGIRWRKLTFQNNSSTNICRSMTMAENGVIYYGGFGDLGYLGNDSLGQKRTNSLLRLVPPEYRNFLDVWSAYSTESGVYFQSREYIIRYDDSKHEPGEKRMMKVWIPKTKFMYAFYLDGNYFVHQQGLGLFKMVNDSLVLIPGSEFLGKERMQIMLPYPSATGEKQYLIGLFYSGLYLYDGKTFRRFITQADPIFRSGINLYKGLQLKNGSYVLSTTGKGLVIIDAQGIIQQKINRDVGLQDETIYATFIDKRGSLWLGLDNGISRVEIASPVTKFGSQSGINSGVLSINRFGGDLYIGISNGLLVFNNKTAHFERVPGMLGNQVFQMLQVGNELIIPADGLFGVRNMKAHAIRASVSADLTLNGVYHSKKYPNVLLCAGNFGVAVFEKKSEPSSSNGSGTWHFTGYIPGIKDQLWTLAENSDGTIWAGTQVGRSYLIRLAFDAKDSIDLKNTKFEIYGPGNGYKNGLGNVFSIKGSNYFPGDSALYTFDDKQKKFRIDSTFGIFKKGGGFTEFDMDEDARGRVWIRLGKELRLAVPRPEGGYFIDTTEMREINDFTIQKIYPEKTGIVWICTTDGLMRYDEKLRKENDPSFKTLLRFVSAGKSELNTAISQDEKLVSVSFKKRTLRFEYAAPFFEQEEKTLYQTWLEGFEKNWSDFDYNYYKEYTNLPAGKYHFHVRAKNVYEKLSEEAVYSFSIRPPWYASGWAYLLYILTALAIVYTIIRWRTRQLHEKHRELEKIVAERTVQLSLRLDELAVINSVQGGLVREMDIQGIYELVGEKIREIFHAQIFDIVTYDSKTNLLEDHYSYENGDRTLVGKWEPSGFRKIVIDTQQVLLINKDLDKRSQEINNKVISGEQPKSALFVPLISGGHVTGMISLQDLDRENAFPESSVNLLTTLANSMSVALESARRFDETKLLLTETAKGKKNVELLSDIGKKITASLDYETIFYELYGHINQLVDASIFGVGIYHAERQQIEYSFAIENGRRYQPYTRDTSDKNQLPVWCIENRMPILLNDVPNEYSRYINSYETTERLLEDGSVSLPPLSIIYIPLIVKDKVLGIISIQSFRKNAYTEYHLNLLQNLATYTSIALDNASAYRQLNKREQEIAQRATELSTVNTISKALASQLDTDVLIKMVGDHLKDLFKANLVYLALLNQKTKIIHFLYQYGDKMRPIKLGEGLTSKIILNGEPLLINKDLPKHRAQLGVERIGLAATSYLGVPIPVGGENIGVLSVQSTEKENRFNENDLRLLSTIASSVGVALRNATLFEDVKLAKMEAEAASKAAEKANEAKSAFLSTVSHELRTPLTSVLGFAKIIKKRLEEKLFPLIDHSDPKTEKTIQQVSENLNVVVSEGERLTHLINDVLDLAKIEAGKMEWNMEPIPMPEIVERAIAATSSLFEQKRLTLKREIENDLPVITGDRDKLIQVVVNLLSNAVKFTDSGSIICRVFQKDNEVIVGIMDTGIGIAPKDHATVFEQFKQVGDTLIDKPKGTGLGLPICKEIVEHQGGHIWLESELGKGSTFFFALPVNKTEVIKPINLDELVKQLKEQMARSQLNMKEQGITILVVDDEESIRSLLRQELSDAGYNVEEAGNGKEALGRIRANKPDLIILDVMMPEMNGFEVASILKNDPQTMDIPIIILSIVQDKARGFRIGVDRYLTKPIDSAELFAEVGTLLEQGKSKKKVMIVDEDSAAVRSLTEVLETKGYNVVESDGKELMKKAISTLPDIIILNSLFSEKQQIVQSLRFEKGLENVLFLIYQ